VQHAVGWGTARANGGESVSPYSLLSAPYPPESQKRWTGVAGGVLGAIAINLNASLPVNGNEPALLVVAVVGDGQLSG